MYCGLTYDAAISILTAVAASKGYDATIAFARDYIVNLNVWDLMRTNGIAWCVIRVWGIAYHWEVAGEHRWGA